MTLVVIAIGLIVGSFFNVLLARFPHFSGVLTGRSQCPHCKRTLAWYELVPFVSFLVLRARCRTCRKPISWMYPAVELSTALVLTVFWMQYGIPQTLQAGLWFFLLMGFLLLFWFDLRDFILPDVVLVPLIMGTLIVLLVSPNSIISGVYTGFLLSLCFGILYVVSRGRWMGFGDVKLILLVGVAFGFPFGPLIVISAIWLACAVGIILVVIRRATGKTALPLGSFISLCAILYILFAHHVETLRWIFS